MTRGRGRPPEGALGGDQIEGRHAVRELLAAGRRRVHSVTISDRVESNPLVDEIVSLAGRALQVVDADRLRALARTDSPQGVVARADPLAAADVDALLSEPRAFLVALDGVTDPGNLGAVLRVAETAGVSGVVLPRHRGALVTPAVTKAAAGALEYVPIALVGGIPAALERAARSGVWTVGLDAGGERTVDDLPVATERVVLVFGAEGRGLGRLTRARCDVVARIPMYGKLESLNVATAAAIACHAVARSRATAETDGDAV